VFYLLLSTLVVFALTSGCGTGGVSEVVGWLWLVL